MKTQNLDDVLRRIGGIVRKYATDKNIGDREVENIMWNLREMLSSPEERPMEILVPYVTSSESVFKDYIVCLEDGKRFKSLTKHLRSAHGLSPDEYRVRWNLSPNYPMTCRLYGHKGEIK